MKKKSKAIDFRYPGLYRKYLDSIRNWIEKWPHYTRRKKEMVDLLSDEDDAFVCYHIPDDVDVNDVDELVTFIKQVDELVDSIAENGKVVITNATGVAYVGWRPGDTKFKHFLPDTPAITTCSQTGEYFAE